MFHNNFDNNYDQENLSFLIDPNGSLRPFNSQLPKPDICPHCSKNIDPVFLSAFEVNDTFIEDIETSETNGKCIASYQCPSCKKPFADYLISVRDTDFDEIENKPGFLGRFSKGKENGPISFSWKSFATAPRKIIKLSIPENIETVSNRFVDIYHQSAQAESDCLNELAGMGYRKAIEILLTDFLIAFPPDDKITKEWVTKPTTTAANKISKIENPRIEKTARAISWIGNDESHYTKVNEEKDIHEMKKFIKLLLNLIDQEIIYNGVEDFTNK